jgi:hypothetical protein
MMPEWTLKAAKRHYVIYNNAGLVRIKCRHCEFVVVADKKNTLFAINLIHKHLNELHGIPLSDVDQ